MQLVGMSYVGCLTQCKSVISRIHTLSRNAAAPVPTVATMKTFLEILLGPGRRKTLQRKISSYVMQEGIRDIQSMSEQVLGIIPLPLTSVCGVH